MDQAIVNVLPVEATLYQEGMYMACNVSCMHIPTDGAHVKYKGESNKWWIIPFCHACNKNTGEITLKVGTKRIRGLKCRG